MSANLKLIDYVMRRCDIVGYIWWVFFCVCVCRVKDVVNRNSTTKPLRALKQKRKYFPKKVIIMSKLVTRSVYMFRPGIIPHL